ncbi:MAG: PrpF domain-containing protein, partial [Pseudomonadota bacterium]
MKRLRCVIMRGGTSKGVFFHKNEVSEDPDERKRVILRAFGSPDKRQIDGLGGADILTSKAAIVGPPSREDADVDYVFGQVGITEPEIDFTTICGNLSAAVAPFAVDEGLVRGKEPGTKVRIFCSEVGRYLISVVQVKDSKFLPEGDYKVDGVPGTGSRISLDFKDTAGLITGATLPTGNPKDLLKIAGVGNFEVSIVDVANVAIFIRAGELGLKGTESPTEIDRDRKLVGTIEKIRMAVAEMIHLSRELDSWKRGTSPLLPILAIVREPMPWVNFVTGST